ncbi:MAG: hypothetical protein H7Z21_11785 [Hymenobacter sp.]|nr:hypothetical protein [Hymenobacter sp.]
MKKLLKFPLLLALLVAGTLLTSCAGSTQAVVTTRPVRPYYGPRYYRPAPVIVRPAPVIVRPRAVIVHPGPRYYRPYGGGYRGGWRRY